MPMKKRYQLIRRGERGHQFYCVDSETGRRFSLKTKDRDVAEQIVLAKNQSLRQPSLNLQIAKAYLAGTDKRQEVHREDEWQARGELLALAREAIARWKKAEHRCGTLEGIARLLDLASKLGRVSSGLSLEPVEKTGEEDAAFMIQIEVALEKIYGPVGSAKSEVRGAKETVVDDMGVAFGQAGEFRGVQAGVHAGEDSEFASGRHGEAALVAEGGDVALIGVLHFREDRCHNGQRVKMLETKLRLNCGVSRDRVECAGG